MTIDRVRLANFRCFTAAEIKPAPGINVITGDNASGKTSVLEAIFFLGRGESFRQSSARQAIHHDADDFVLNAEVSAQTGRPHRLAVQRSKTAIQYKRDGERATRLDLVNSLPLQLIDPNVHRLLEQGPRYRRHFLDWGVFHVEHAFFPAWRRYRRALRQRNRALKARWPKKDTIAWDAELVRCAEIIDACRRAYIDHLSQALPESARRIVGSESVTLEYDSGWRGDEGFGKVLATQLERDQKAGFTQQGPHRADIRVMAAESKARDWVSRGQQKMLTAALLISQASILINHRGILPVLLIDDLAAELGARYRETLVAEVKTLGGQCFLTFLDAGVVPSALADAQMFHVERGVVFTP